MSFFRTRIDSRRKVYLSLTGQVESQLRDAYAKKHETDGVTQTGLAQKLGVNRSAINHRLRGRVNMTLETLADMVWALGLAIQIVIYDPRVAGTNWILSEDDGVEPSSKAEAEIVPLPGIRVTNSAAA